MDQSKDTDAPNYLRQWRKHRRLTLEQVGDAIGTDKTQISKLEKGERKVTIEWLERLSNPLRATAQQLMGPPPGDARGESSSATGDSANTPLTSLSPSFVEGPWRNEASSEGAPTLPAPGTLPRDLPVVGGGQGGDGTGDFELNGRTVDWTRRPPALAGIKEAFAVYVYGDSMYPRYEPGDLVFVHPGRRYTAGRDVLVELRNGDDEELAGPALIKRFISESREKLILEQFNPPKKIIIPMRQVKRILLILKPDELFRV